MASSLRSSISRHVVASFKCSSGPQLSLLQPLRPSVFAPYSVLRGGNIPSFRLLQPQQLQQHRHGLHTLPSNFFHQQSSRSPIPGLSLPTNFFLRRGFIPRDFFSRRCLVPANFFNHTTSSSRTNATLATNAGQIPLQQAYSSPSSQTKTGYPDVSSPAVAYWLFSSAALVFLIVVVGGLTRLTESGLSITEWKPVTGSLPPLSQSDWENEFAAYKDSPEYRLLNPNMTLDEYKFIYYMEWSHRLLGRIIGLGFVIPAIYFVMKGKVSKRDAYKLFGIAVGIGIQGGIGWWMVRSGLGVDKGGTQNFDETGGHVRVSQYRLTAHLGAAFLVYAGMKYTALSILRDYRLLVSASKTGEAAGNATALKEILRRTSPQFKSLRNGMGLLTALVFVTSMYGALVAGLDAGLVYNEFPTMAGGDESHPWRIIPPSSELFDPSYTRNLTENPITVQLQHRILATTTFCSILGLWAYTHLKKGLRAEMSKPAKKGMGGVVFWACTQVTLGISTLIYFVPTSLAACHQAGALALFTSCIALSSAVFVPRGLMRVLAKRGVGFDVTKGMAGLKQVDTRAREFVKTAGGGAVKP